MTTMTAAEGPVLRVVRAGPLTLVEDLGRPGLAHLAVPRSGALDRAALRRANALVGNPAGAAGLETTLGGVALRAVGPAVVAVTGASAAVAVDGQAAAPGEPLLLGDGSLLEVGPARGGLRCYVAVAGGLAVPTVLGSRSTDVLSGLGPPPVRAGDVLPVGEPRGPAHLAPPGAAPAEPSSAPRAEPAVAGSSPAPLVLPITLGPRDDWFTADARATLTSATYRVDPASSRIALRLAGPALTRSVTEELPSEGLVLGAVQVPPDGQPLIFLADHPTTGGYPVIAVVEDEDVDACGQARPGSEVRFVVAGGEAHGRYGAGP